MIVKAKPRTLRSIVFDSLKKKYSIDLVNSHDIKLLVPICCTNISVKCLSIFFQI